MANIRSMLVKPKVRIGQVWTTLVKVGPKIGQTVPILGNTSNFLGRVDRMRPEVAKLLQAGQTRSIVPDLAKIDPDSSQANLPPPLLPPARRTASDLRCTVTPF